MPSLIRTSRKEVDPFGSRIGGTRTAGGQEIIDNPDPTLAYLANNDEREYRVMEESSLTIATAKQRRNTALLSAGHGLEKPMERSERARFIFDWTLAMLRRVDRFNEVLELCLNGLYYGWQPMNKVWDVFEYDGRPWIGPRWIKEKNPEHYRWTKRGSLVYTPSGDVDMEFSAQALERSWMICTSGSTDNPYGKGIYRSVWLPWFITSRFQELMSQGAERAIGLPKLTRQTTTIPGAAGAPDQDPDTVMADAISEVQEMLSLLHSQNVLVGLDGWDLDFITDVNFTNGWRGLLDYFDHQISVRVAGSAVDSRPQEDRGSRALFQVFRSGGIDVAKADAKKLEAWINQQLIEVAIRANIPDVKDEEIPKWRSLIHYDGDIETIQKLYEMGAPVDGRRVSQVHGVPLGDPDDENAMVLQKQEEPEMESSDGEDGDEDPALDEDAPDSGDAERRQSGGSQRAARWDEMDLMRH